jgi:hypothetical protein
MRQNCRTPVALQRPVMALANSAVNPMQFETIPSSFQSLPVLIEAVDAGAGSGFFLKTGNGLYLVTARHVILDHECKRVCNKLTLRFWLWQDDKVGDHAEYSLNLEKAEQDGYLYCGNDSDIAAVKVATIGELIHNQHSVSPLCEFEKRTGDNGMIFPYDQSATKAYDEVAVGNEAFTIGYPLSLSTVQNSALDVFRPLLRKGLVAGKYDDRKQIVIDCPVYKGNSGGPVIEIYRCGAHCNRNHFKIIGVVSQFVPLVQNWKDDYFGDIRTERSNSGYSIVAPLDAVFALIQEHEASALSLPLTLETGL